MKTINFGPLVINEIPEGVDLFTTPLKVVVGAVSDSSDPFTTPLGVGYVSKVESITSNNIRMNGLVALPSSQVIEDTQIVLGISDDPSDHVICFVLSDEAITIPANGGISFCFKSDLNGTESSLNQVLSSQEFLNSALSQLLENGDDPGTFTFTVTLPTDDHAIIEAYGGSESPVEKGGSFSFIVIPISGYHVSTVLVNDVELITIDWFYTISNIQEDQVVTVVIEQD